ncbi:MAG: hypothetical protein ACOVQS_05840, partial [Chitinophagaceae bacterium]
MKKITIILISLISWNNSQAKLTPKIDTSLNIARTEFQLHIPTSTKIAPIFRLDPSLKNGEFAYRIRRAGQQTNVTFLGGTPIEVTHAVHGFLEHIGFHFGFDGVKHPKTLKPDTIRSGYYLTRPHTRWRGIRQHVNFPMDISSYPQEEAREYLRRLVRMRFNKIAVHSYP